METVRALLIPVTRDQVPDIWKIVDNDSLVVIDELQNFWPSGRQKLSAEITEFVTEHGHRGLDVLCMGQALSDCHTLWKRRIENKLVFSKLSALGAEDRYNWALYKQTSPDKWEKTTSGTDKYDKKYFGTYKSHTDGTTNTGNYQDKRAVIWSSPLFKLGLPAVAVVGGLALYYVVGLFNGGLEQSLAPTSQQKPPARASVQPVSVEERHYRVVNGQRVEVTPQHTTSTATSQAPAPAPQAMQTVSANAHIQHLNESNRVRLAAVIQSAMPRIFIEWRDLSGRVVETLESRDIQALGWSVMLNTSGTMAILTNGQQSHVVTAWPIDESVGRVPQSTNNAIKSSAEKA